MYTKQFLVDELFNIMLALYHTRSSLAFLLLSHFVHYLVDSKRLKPGDGTLRDVLALYHAAPRRPSLERQAGHVNNAQRF